MVCQGVPGLLGPFSALNLLSAISPRTRGVQRRSLGARGACHSLFLATSVERAQKYVFAFFFFFLRLNHYEIILLEPVQGGRLLTSPTCIPVSPVNHTKNLSKLPPNTVVPLTCPTIHRTEYSSDTTVPTMLILKKV